MQDEINRVHDRIDSEMSDTRQALGALTAEMRDMAVNQARTATILERMEAEQKRQAEDRKATCPNASEIDRVLATAYAIGGKADPVKGATEIVNRVNLIWAGGKWMGGVIVTCAVIPSGIWFFRWVAKAVAAAVS